MISGSFWGHGGITLGPFWGRVGVTLNSFWVHFGIRQPPGRQAEEGFLQYSVINNLVSGLRSLFWNLVLRY